MFRVDTAPPTLPPVRMCESNRRDKLLNVTCCPMREVAEHDKLSKVTGFRMHRGLIMIGIVLTCLNEACRWCRQVYAETTAQVFAS